MFSLSLFAWTVKKKAIFLSCNTTLNYILKYNHTKVLVKDALETLMHTLRDCEIIQEFSKKYIRVHWVKFFSLGTKGWLKWNLTTTEAGSPHVHWPTLFSIATSAIWTYRNKWVFSRKTQLPDGLVIHM